MAKGTKRPKQESAAKLFARVLFGGGGTAVLGVLIGSLYLMSVAPHIGEADTRALVRNAAPAEEDSEAGPPLIPPGSRISDLLAEIQAPLVIRYQPGGFADPQPSAVQTFTTMLESRSGRFSFSEGDLNRIVSESLRIESNAAAVVESMAEQGKSTFTVPRTLNFRIADERLQVSSSLEIHSVVGTTTVTFLTAGSFGNRDSGPEYLPEFVYLNSLRVPPPLDALVAEGFFEALATGLFAERPGDGPPRLQEVLIANNRLELSL